MLLKFQNARIQNKYTFTSLSIHRKHIFSRKMFKCIFIIYSIYVMLIVSLIIVNITYAYLHSHMEILV